MTHHCLDVQETGFDPCPRTPRLHGVQGTRVDELQPHLPPPERAGLPDSQWPPQRGRRYLQNHGGWTVETSCRQAVWEGIGIVEIASASRGGWELHPGEKEVIHEGSDQRTCPGDWTS